MSLEIDLPSASIRVKVSDLEKVGAGGEGSVYLLRHQSGTFAIKRYHQPSQERIQKLEAAIAARPVNAVFGEGDDAVVQMAWPLGLVREHGESLGFVMPYVDSKKAMELDYFISPVLAKDARHLEKPNLAVRLQIAQNLCSVVNSLHEVGHYFIDFKPQNIKVYQRSLHVCLIDCDSFSVTHNGVRYPASAYSPQFINPIALVNDQPPSALGEEQDNWAIAVALFMLLNFDLHPYDGRASPSVTVTAVDDFVKMGLYAYGPRPHPLVTPKPASVHNLWPSELRALFDRAFTDPQRAPTMSEWVQYLQSILQNKQIARCDSKPNAVDHLKFLGNGCMQCAFESRQKPRAIKQRPAKPRSVEPPAAPKPSPVTNSSKPSFPYTVPIPAQKKMSGEAKAFWGLLIFFIIVFALNYVEDGEQTSASQAYTFQPVAPRPEEHRSPELAVIELIGQYSQNCVALKNRPGIPSLTFSKAAAGRILSTYSEGDGSYGNFLEVTKTEGDGRTLLLWANLLEVDDQRKSGEIQLVYNGNWVRILRLVDISKDRAAVLNGYEVGSGDETVYWPKCY